MGIPHLITFLQPYATVESLAGHELVIDGPAFAHHVYYICLRATPTARNAFEAAPSYSVLVNTALAWLDGLRASDAVIKKIYWDGLLPAEKFDIRLGRLIDNTRRLTVFYHKNPQPCRMFYPRFENKLSRLFDSSSIQSNITSLPPLPFLVPAILEAVQRSPEYGAITETVPGEADLWCAQYVSENGGLVLTGDSDLLVHDIGPNGAVSFLKDIFPSPEHSPTSILCSLLYRPASIAERLTLPLHLRSLAFEMVMDPHITFPQLLKQARPCKAITNHPKEFTDFLKQYDQLPPSLSQTHNNFAQIQLVLRTLDPRISECVLQFPYFARKDEATLLFERVHIFLPFLLDCPIRTSAWECSTPTRQLAYGLLNLMDCRDAQTPSVFEHRKQTDKSDGRELQLPQISSIPNECDSILTLLSEIRTQFPGLSEIWTAVAIHQHNAWSIAQDKPCLAAIFTKQYQQLECLREQSSFSWEAIQFFAELQASHYSFRILKQILDVVLVHGSTNPLPGSLLSLHGQLQTLPDLTEWLSLFDASSALRKMAEPKPMVTIMKIVEVLLPFPAEDISTASKVAKKKRKRELLPLESQVKKRPTNIFELLDTE